MMFIRSTQCSGMTARGWNGKRIPLVSRPRLRWVCGRFVCVVLTLALLAGPSAAFAALGFGPPEPLNSWAATDLNVIGGDSAVELATDGAGTWIAVWTWTDFNVTEDYDIAFARSVDNGATWSVSAPLNTNWLPDSGDDWYHDVATDGAGTWIVVWTSDNDLGGTIGSDEDILVSRSVDNGATWSAPAALNAHAATDSGTTHDSRPQVLNAGTAGWVAVWESHETLGGTIGSDKDLLMAWSTDGGVTWGSPTPFNSDAATDSLNRQDSTVHVTRGAGGYWVAAWMSYDILGGGTGSDWDIFVCRSTDDGTTWSSPTPLNTDPMTDIAWDMRPHVSTGGAGNWVVAWNSDSDLAGGIGSDEDILMSRSADNGATWSVTAALNTNAATDSGTDDYPRLVFDGAGMWLAVWHSSQNLGGSIGSDDDIFVSRSTDSGATWTAPVALNANARTDTGSDGGPCLVQGASGRWLAAWTSTDDLGGTIGTDPDILYSMSDSLEEPEVPAASALGLLSAFCVLAAAGILRSARQPRRRERCRPAPG
jgi:hypothetical protein